MISQRKRARRRAPDPLIPLGATARSSRRTIDKPVGPALDVGNAIEIARAGGAEEHRAMAARVGDDLQPIEAPAIGKASGSSKMIVCPARGLGLAPSRDGRRRWRGSRPAIEARARGRSGSADRGSARAIAFIRPHRLRHVLIRRYSPPGRADCIGPGKQRPRPPARRSRGECAQRRHSRRACRQAPNAAPSRSVGTLPGELGVEILAGTGMTLEGFHVEPAHDCLLSIAEMNGNVGDQPVAARRCSA